MPRVTRAALRSMEQHDESSVAVLVPLPQTPTKGRIPLGEIANNKGAESQAPTNSEERAAPAKKGTGKGKKRTMAKQAKTEMTEKAEEVCVEILEDENQSTCSSAVEACQDLLKDGSQDTREVVIDSDRIQTPPYAASSRASQELSPKPATPHSDDGMQRADNITMSGSREKEEDSFLAKIESRTPLKMTTSEEIGTLPAQDDNKEDSFAERIRTRTPGKRISRIEDSVDALDALEEEIEKIGGSIPGGADDLKSLVKAKKQAKSQPTKTDKKVSDSVRSNKGTVIQKKTAAGRLSTAAKTARPNRSAGTVKTGTRLSTSLDQQKPEVIIQGPAPTRANGQPTSQGTVKNRMSSVHKAPFQPHKSTKPPTRASFELPGEAFARNLKEQREQRLKREEEEVPKPRVFKARPVRISHAPEVKLTAAARLRLSMAKGEPASVRGSPSGVAKSRPATRPSAIAMAGQSKRLSTLSVAKPSTQPSAEGSTQPSASSSTRVTRGPSLSLSTTAPSSLGANRPPLTTAESAHQKLKGKEVFGRRKVEIMEREKAKKEKEAATRQARADAAERGRIASREWAEKQRAKKLEAATTDEQAKTLGA
ncbi:hypothetical protein BDR22DRAFT_816299 [Usnea florida]